MADEKTNSKFKIQDSRLVGQGRMKEYDGRWQILDSG
jgi:hypothetical protein